jgi:hypothetical protein
VVPISNNELGFQFAISNQRIAPPIDKMQRPETIGQFQNPVDQLVPGRPTARVMLLR